MPKIANSETAPDPNSDRQTDIEDLQDQYIERQQEQERHWMEVEEFKTTEPTFFS